MTRARLESRLDQAVHGLIGQIEISAGEVEARVAERLAGYLRQWLEQVPKHEPAPDQEISPETLEALRAMGYIEDE